ncbi:hypothetical protein GPALN_005175 [Globodera pallida]|nr:hypothetical protein GPALN_005175 [Globodera pallida]
MLFLSFLIFLFFIFFSFARVCEAEEQSSASATATASSLPYTQLKGPITSDFQEWLKKNGYDRLHLEKLVANPQNSYGGRQFEGQTLKNRPVIFIHGNSDGALAQGDEEWAQGWSANIEYFLNNGYSSAEMYAITYGNRNLTYAMNRVSLQAVLQYTGFQYVDIVAHSMGVTIARIIIQGKTFSEAGKGCHASSVVTEALHIQTNASNHLKVSIWSKNDTVLGATNLAWGHQTSLIPFSDRSIVCDGPSHFALKWATLEDQLAILRQQ